MTDIDQYFSDIDKLKHREREGWIKRHVPGVKDTIASHSFGAALLGWVLAKTEGLDEGKVIKLLLMHDLIMAHIGDFTPGEKEYISKREMENKAGDAMLSHIPKEIQDEMKALFLEYQAGSTKEAILARECDKLDTLFQAREYSKKTGKDELSEFLETYKAFFRTKSGKEIWAGLRCIR